MSTQLLATIRDGKIEPSQPIDLPEGTEIIVTIDSRSENEKDEEWYALSLQGLNRAYSDDEPEYELYQIKEFNPDYEGR
jgi:predicted DNA-binding antitoxin AbrB/MazE fold protein